MLQSRSDATLGGLLVGLLRGVTGHLLRGVLVAFRGLGVLVENDIIVFIIPQRRHRRVELPHLLGDDVVTRCRLLFRGADLRQRLSHCKPPPTVTVGRWCSSASLCRCCC